MPQASPAAHHDRCGAVGLVRLTVGAKFYVTHMGDAEPVTLAMMQAILDYTSEAKWLRCARARLRHFFPYLPQQPDYKKRLGAALLG